MNWGMKIVVGLAVFMSFIVGLGIYMVSKNTDTLEDSDYYERSLTYDDVYIRKQNLVDNKAKPTVAVRADTLYIGFQSAPNSGELRFKRPADARLDQTLTFDTKTKEYVLPLSSFVKGSWSLEIHWTGAAKDYVSTHPIYL